eukprot:6207855-Pleurochrysis_carterae.AAC.2
MGSTDAFCALSVSRGEGGHVNRRCAHFARGSDVLERCTSRPAECQRGLSERQGLEGAVLAHGGVAAGAGGAQVAQGQGLLVVSSCEPEEHVLGTFLAICRQPAGRAHGSRGSQQQCCFEMELWDDRVEHMLDLRRPGFTCMRRKRYSVGESGKERQVAKAAIVYGSSKAVVNRAGQGVRVVCTLIPPLIVELCRRTHKRFALVVTCNLFTLNDLGRLSLHPHFKYAPGECEAFKELAIYHLMRISNAPGHRLSRLMQQQLPPAYLNGEDHSADDGADAESAN